MEYGIPKQDVYIDCLTLTASAEQDGVKETLKALRMVTEKLGLKTVLGVSNISFGLPNRELVNTTFISLAMQCGLTLPIMNPNIAGMTGAVRAFRLLSGYDRHGVEFIENYGAGSEEASRRSCNSRHGYLRRGCSWSESGIRGGGGEAARLRHRPDGTHQRQADSGAGFRGREIREGHDIPAAADSVRRCGARRRSTW